MVFKETKGHIFFIYFYTDEPYLVLIEKSSGKSVNVAMKNVINDVTFESTLPIPIGMSKDNSHLISSFAPDETTNPSLFSDESFTVLAFLSFKDFK